MFDYNSSLSMITLLLSVIIFVRSIMLRRRLTAQSDLLTKQTEQLLDTQNKLLQNQELQTREIDFQSNLKQAEVITELQKPRSSFTHTRNGRRPPERYEYARSMFGAGMPTEEISSALRMSSDEISQIQELANLCLTHKANEQNNEIVSVA